MLTELHLNIHNVLSIGSAIVFFGTAFFTFLNAPRKTANVTLALTALATAVFFVSHVVGVNLTDPEASRAVLMFNLSNFFFAMFNLHAVLALLKQEKQKRSMLIFAYASGLAFVIVFLIFPDLFLLPSVPKMYFPNYYNPGVLNWIRMGYVYVVMVPYITYLLSVAYRRAASALEKRQYLFFIIAFLGAYGIGFVPNLLVYNVQVDPMWGMLCGLLFAVPFVYGAVQYGLFNVRVIAKQAFWYSIAVALVGGLITTFNYSNELITQFYPGFPVWAISMLSALLAVTASVIIWRKLREGDLLKYEFITTVTHKFRTPLTHIKWAAENLVKAQDEGERRVQLEYIQSANAKLVELTGLLMNVSEAENSVFDYSMVRGDVSATVNEAVASMDNQVKAKNIRLVSHIPAGMFAAFDASRIKFVIQTFVENAIHYTPDNATVTVTVSKVGKEVVCSVKDTGIGISKDELPLLFAKFYRGRQAKLADTEGMGIGLFMVKQIMSHHRGRAWAESEGEGRGSTFSISLPAVK